MPVWFLAIAILLSLTPRAWAAPLSFSDREDFSQAVSVYEDKDDSQTIESIRRLDGEGQFQTRAQLGKNGFGFTRSSIWVRAHVYNDTQEREWFLGSTRPDFTTIDVYIFDASGQLIHKDEIGTLVPERLLDTRMPADRFYFEPGAAYTVYMKVRSPLQLSLTFFLSDPKTYFNFAVREGNAFFAYFGTVIALILYNFCLFVFLRHRDYLFYAFFGLAMVLNAYIQGGFLEQGWLKIPFLSNVNDSFRVMLFPSIASILYTRSFLRVKSFAPSLDKWMVRLIWLAVVFALALNFDFAFPLRPLVSTFDGIAVIFVFIASGLAIRRGDRTAKVFLLAWGTLAIAVAIWVMGNAGVIEKTMLIAFAPLIGNMIEMVLMSIALALRIKELEAGKIQAEMKAREKDNLQHLLRMVCHDISNPLSIVKTMYFLQSKRPDEVQPEEKKRWDRIKRASDSIESIINQVRKYEAFRSGKLAFELKPCSVKKVFEDVEFFFNMRAAEKGVRLQLDPIDGDLYVMADETSLSHEIINNLISNAIKFTEPGGTVRLSARVKDGRISLSVQDSGIGMPQEILDNLFDPKARTSRSGTTQEIGTGFGMPLVKTFLELFGGTIEVKSLEASGPEGERGTTMTIHLLEAAPKAAALARSQPEQKKLRHHV